MASGASSSADAFEGDEDVAVNDLFGDPPPDTRPLPKSAFARLQRRMWALLDDPGSSLTAKLLSSFMMIVILLSIANFTLASNPHTWYTDVWVNASTGLTIVGSEDTEVNLLGAYRTESARRVSDELDESRWPFSDIETFCILIFTFEYIARLAASPQGPGVARYLVAPANIIDLVSIMPWYIEYAMVATGATASGIEVLSVLRLIRLTRIGRIFKVSRSFEGLIMLLRSLRKSVPALLMLFLFMGLSGIFFATLIFTAEGGTYDEYRQQYVRDDGSASPFESIPGSLWWTIVTMTTVGYGDQYPVTAGGKIVAVLTMFCGLVVLSLPITIIGANFDEEYRLLRKRKQDEKDAISRRLRDTVKGQRRPIHISSEAAGMEVGADMERLSIVKATCKDVARKTTSGDTVPKERASEDAIRVIQTLIHESHFAMTTDMEALMASHENKLRMQIKDVLRRHAEGVGLHKTPLDVLSVVEAS